MMSGVPSIGIVVSTFNRSTLLKNCLEALCDDADALMTAEVVVVDSHSSDGTAGVVAAAKARGLNVRYMHSDNVLAVKRNVGAAALTTDVLVFLDDDCIPDPGFVADCRLSLLRETSRRVVVCGGVYFPSAEVARSNFVRLRDSRHFRASGAAGKSVEFQQIVAMNMCVWREEFVDELGGFDETFVGYGSEDTELGWRLKRLGWTIVVGRQSVEHREPSQTLAQWRKKMVRVGQHGAARLLTIAPDAVWALRWSWILEPTYPHASRLRRVLASVVRRMLMPSAALALVWFLDKMDPVRVFYAPILYRYVFAVDYLCGVRQRVDGVVNRAAVRAGWYS